MTVDLNRWSAENVMGWVWTLISDDDLEQIYWWIDPKTDESALPIYQDDEYNFQQSLWTPLTDWNQLKLVIEKMRELGWFIILSGNYDGFKVFYIKPVPMKEFIKGKAVTNMDLPTAVLQAAYEALKGEKP